MRAGWGGRALLSPLTQHSLPDELRRFPLHLPEGTHRLVFLHREIKAVKEEVKTRHINAACSTAPLSWQCGLEFNGSEWRILPTRFKLCFGYLFAGLAALHQKRSLLLCSQTSRCFPYLHHGAGNREGSSLLPGVRRTLALAKKPHSSQS